MCKVLAVIAGEPHVVHYCSMSIQAEPGGQRK